MRTTAAPAHTGRRPSLAGPRPARPFDRHGLEATRRRAGHTSPPAYARVSRRADRATTASRADRAAGRRRAPLVEPEGRAGSPLAAPTTHHEAPTAQPETERAAAARRQHQSDADRHDQQRHEQPEGGRVAEQEHVHQRTEYGGRRGRHDQQPDELAVHTGASRQDGRGGHAVEHQVRGARDGAAHAVPGQQHRQEEQPAGDAGRCAQRRGEKAQADGDRQPHDVVDAVSRSASEVRSTTSSIAEWTASHTSRSPVAAPW